MRIITKIVDCTEAVTAIAGFSGAALVLLGGASCFLGVSSKAIDKLAQSLKPHQPLTQKMVNYGAFSAFTGMLLTGSAVLAAKTVGEYLADKEIQEQIKESNQLPANTKIRACDGCIYYSGNNYLPCAVHPHLSANCPDFAAK